MQLNPAQLETFRSRFEAKEPAPKNLRRRLTKFAFYLSVEDLVEQRRKEGFSWAGIAEDFTELGVQMSVATLKTCARRARARRRARPRRNARQSASSARDSATPPTPLGRPAMEEAAVQNSAAETPPLDVGPPSVGPGHAEAESDVDGGSGEEENARPQRDRVLHGRPGAVISGASSPSSSAPRAAEEPATPEVETPATESGELVVSPAPASSAAAIGSRLQELRGRASPPQNRGLNSFVPRHLKDL